MLSNVRRKMTQKNIKKYSELRIEDWWNSDIIAYLHENLNFENQRYSKSKVKKTFDKNKISMFIPYEIDGKIYNMIPCPSGTFTKGSNDPDARNPIEEKKIEKSFLLGETEVTQELYCAVMSVENPSEFQDDPKNPVEKVSWYDAVMFCNKMSDIFELEHYYTIGNAQKIKKTNWERGGKHYPVETNKNSKGFRLPTEDEWEYAAKAGTQLEYSGSNNVDEVGWHEKNSNNKTNPVKGKKPNAWGFYDMSGNVEEWCEDNWNSDDAHISADRVARGGSWGNDTSVLCSAYRDGSSPDLRNSLLGFRVCRYI